MIFYLVLLPHESFEVENVEIVVEEFAERKRGATINDHLISSFQNFERFS